MGQKTDQWKRGRPQSSTRKFGGFIELFCTPIRVNFIVRKLYLSLKVLLLSSKMTIAPMGTMPFGAQNNRLD